MKQPRGPFSSPWHANHFQMKITLCYILVPIISHHKLTGSERRVEEHACVDAVISSLSPSQSLIKCRSHPKKPVITTGWGNGVPAELCDLPKHTSQTGQAGWGFPVSDTHTPCAIQPRHWDFGAGSQETNKQLLHSFSFLRSSGFFQISTWSQGKNISSQNYWKGEGLRCGSGSSWNSNPLFKSPLVTRVLRFDSTKLPSVSLDAGDSKVIYHERENVWWHMTWTIIEMSTHREIGKLRRRKFSLPEKSEKAPWINCPLRWLFWFYETTLQPRMASSPWVLGGATSATIPSYGDFENEDEQEVPRWV